MNMGVLLRATGMILDSVWDEDDTAIATPLQVRAINIYLRQLTKPYKLRGKVSDQARYEVVRQVLDLSAPASTKQFTRGQAAAFIRLTRHQKYAHEFEQYIASIIESVKETAA